MLAGKETEEQLVLDAIRAHCLESPSSDEIFHRIASALDEGDELVLRTISNGVTNHSYKVFLEQNTEVALYAKVARNYALWDAAQGNFSSERVENELKVMLELSSIVPGVAPIATPYFCQALKDGMRLLVAEYKEGREPWANQFLTGEVDLRVLPALADVTARLHCMDGFDRDFNAEVKSFFEPIMLDSKKRVLAMFEAQRPTNRVEELARKYGREECTIIMDSLIENVKARDCMIHNDLHAFNILVEERSTDGQFGETGSITICDFEVSTPGPIGRDVGLLLGYPISCTLWHASQGRELQAGEILDFIECFWDEYSSNLGLLGCKDKAFMTDTHRNIVGWCGWFLAISVCFYGSYANTFRFSEETEDEELITLMESIGVVGLQLLRWGFGGFEPELTIQELRTSLMQTVQNEEDRLLGVKCYVWRNHRDSLILHHRRTSSCSSQISDASSFSPNAKRRDSDVM